MPELPEIETIKRSLLPLTGERIAEVDIRRGDIIRRQDFSPALLQGIAWETILRRGKYLGFSFGGGSRWLTVHLGMSGRFYQVEALPSEKHIHMVIALSGGSCLIFQDPRRFGGLWFTEGSAEPWRKLGPEPLEAGFTLVYLESILHPYKAAVKNILLNQERIAGLGNIYVDESLFAAGIHPEKAGSQISRAECGRLHQAIIQILNQSIEARGTTFRDYRDGWNQAGSFQERLAVYGRGGEPCRICGNLIKTMRLGGRGTYYCSHCQT